MRSEFAQGSMPLPPATLVTLLLVAALLPGCTSEAGKSAGDQGPEEEAQRPASNPDRNAYFGDLHVHTRYSFDAYIFNVRATPDDAYRYARGGIVQHSEGQDLQLSEPLDFLAVTDHGSFLGLVAAMDEPEHPLYETELAQRIRAGGPENGFRIAVAAMLAQEFDAIDDKQVSWDAWARIQEAADEHYVPGEFTTFHGYEYTSPGENVDNLHRNVIFRDSSPATLFQASTSRNPEDLWRWLDERRSEGFEALAIPHNSNGSGGRMFELSTYEGAAIDADYVELRSRNEPLVEVTQVKGDSETHPLLSPNDEWADFETMPFKIASGELSEPSGSYVREALVHGLEMEERESLNPFRFGFIGSSDTHNAAGTPEENDFHSKTGMRDGTPYKRGSVPDEAGRYSPAAAAYKTWSASGLAAVWAEENTREAIYAAMRRKETFATSGPRIRLRFFAGFGFAEDLLDQPDLVAQAYAGGVAMGGDLVSEAGAAVPGVPGFVAWAQRDPRSAPLQRLQVVKGWVDANGVGQEQVFDVACSDGLAVDPISHRCADNGATVDPATCAWSPDLGASELKTLWRDPQFEPNQRAFYYLRVLENPSCRWSTWDALRAGVAPNPELPATLQERAYSSPIWFEPNR